MYDTILAEIKTTADRYMINEEIEQLLKSLYELGDQGFEQVLKSKVRDRIASVIRRDTNIEGVNKEEYLRGVSQRVEALPVVKMELGFEPTGISIDKFSQFIATALGRNVLIEHKYRKDLVGGVIIEFNGEYRDFSLKRLINEEFARLGSELMGTQTGNLQEKTETPLN